MSEKLDGIVSHLKEVKEVKNYPLERPDSKEETRYPEINFYDNILPDAKDYNVGDSVTIVLKGNITNISTDKQESKTTVTCRISVKKAGIS